MIRKLFAIGALAMSLAFAAGVVAAAPPTDACFLDPPTIATDTVSNSFHFGSGCAAAVAKDVTADPIAAIPKPALIHPVVRRSTCPVVPASTPKMPRLHFDPGRSIA